MNKMCLSQTIKMILSVTFIGMFILLTGCGNKAAAPFTDVTWKVGTEEMTASMGEALKTYDSIYGGTTYVYNTSYEGRDGVIKYMYDDKDALMCVAFTYVPETADEVLSLYEEIHSSLEKELGESGYKADHDTNYGDVWYRDEGDIIISCMITSEQNSLQYSYLNPVVSKYQMEEAAGLSTDSQ